MNGLTSYGRGLGILWPVLPIGFIAGLLGLAIGSESYIVLALLVMLLGATAAGFASHNLVYHLSRHLIWIGWIVVLLSTGFHQTTSIPVGYSLELIIFGSAFAAASMAGKLAKSDREMRLIILLWFGFLALGIFSSLVGRSLFWAALWQFQYNLKWPLMLGLGLLIAWSNDHEVQLKRVVAYSWLVLGSCLVVEIAAPGMHQMGFGPPPDLHGNPLLGIGLRYRGPFTHSGYLALYSAFLCSTAVALTLCGHGKKWLWTATIYFGLLLAAGQRQELLACLLALVLLLGTYARRQWPWLSIGAGLVVIGVAAGLTLTDASPLHSLLAEWGLVAGTAPLSERAILTYGGLSVAKDYLPIGSGLGTYGGVGAQKFDLSLFVELGFMRYWWFRQNLFLVDTFWPNILAESGLLGGLSIIALFLVLWRRLLRLAINGSEVQTPLLALVALAALTLLLANSPTSTSITDPRSSFLFWLLIGSAIRAGAAKAASPNVTPQ